MKLLSIKNVLKGNCTNFTNKFEFDHLFFISHVYIFVKMNGSPPEIFAISIGKHYKQDLTIIFKAESSVCSQNQQSDEKSL